MRIRIKFSKLGAMQYIGHLDLHRSWERTFRRAGLPLDYSQGFHPQPHLNLACALPLGFTSDCELLDAWLQQDIPLATCAEKLSAAAPPGIKILAVEAVAEHTPALQTEVTAAVYRITFLDAVADLDDRLQKILSASQLPRVRREKAYDLRPLIEGINVIPGQLTSQQEIRVQLATREAATGRPEELLDEMGIRFENTRIHREELILATR